MFHGTRTDVVLQQQWHWPYIFGSFIVAWVGSLTALHIMKQRTSDKGLSNLVYLLAGSVAFGAVGVWSMHFIGMQALSLIDPSTGSSMEIRYDPLYTAFSLIVVVVIVAIGFYVAGDPLNQQWWRYVFGGVAGAGGVLTMHYLGMLAMTMQAVIEFNWRWVLGSVLIGVAVVSVGLLVFFRFRQLWQHNQLVLLACSLVLGVAVMGVHYSGLASATYYKTIETPNIDDYSPVSRLLYVNIALASATCCAALVYLVIKYVRMLQHEQRKLKCLILNALILDTPPPNSTSQPPRVLCTIADTLPSIVIEQQYEGIGAFDRDNADFLRMYKTSTDWVGHDTYSRFLCQLKANGTLSSYSLALHNKFISAAKELCEHCGLQMSELDLLYWQPTQAVVTVVLRVSPAVGERVEKTTNCRFVAQETLHTAVSCIADDIDGKQWMEELINFHTRSTLPLPPPPIPTLSLPLPPTTFRSRISRGTPPRSPSKLVSPTNSGTGSVPNTLTARTKRFFANSVSPAVSPRPPATDATPTNAGDAKIDSPTGASKGSEAARTSAASSESSKDGISSSASNSYKLYLGLHYVKVEANGLHLMILNNGPYHHLPVTLLLESTTPFNTLSAEQTNYLRELRLKHLDFELGAQCMLPPPAGHDKPAGHEKKIKEAAQDGGTAGVGGGSAGSGGLASARPRFATSRTASVADEVDDEVDDDASTVRGDPNVKETLRQLKKTNTSSSTPSSPTGGQQRVPPSPLTADLPTFTAAFNHACYSLTELLGTSSDLQPANLHQMQLLPYGAKDWVLAFSVVRMSTRLDNYSQHHTIRWVSLKTFEILHYARHNRPEGKGWTRRWVKERTKRTSTAGLAGGLHDVEDSVESGGRTRRGTEKADASEDRRVTTASEAAHGSDSALLKAHPRGQSISHHRADSVSKSKKIALVIAHSQSAMSGSLPGSMPGTARAVLLLTDEEESMAVIV